MLLWVAYAIGTGIALCFAGVSAESVLARYGLPRRSLWFAVLALSLSAAGVALFASSPPPEGRSDDRSEWGDAILRAQLHSSVAPSATSGGGAEWSRQEASQTSPDSSGRRELVERSIVLVWGALTLSCLIALGAFCWRSGRLRQRLPLTRIDGTFVRVSRDLGPAVIGVVEQEIVVPGWFLSLGPDAQKMGLTHEREHIRSRDPLVLLLALVGAALMPWNVALWYAVRRLRQAMEIDCDQRVLSHQFGAHAYCSLLLDVEERAQSARVGTLGTALSLHATSLEHRIDVIAAGRPSGWRASFQISLAACFVVAACQAPRPVVSTSVGASTLAGQLMAVLSSDSGRRSLSIADRTRLRQALAASDSGGLEGPATSLQSSAEDLSARIAAAQEVVGAASTALVTRASAIGSRATILDSLVRASYSALITRQDTTLAFVAVVLDLHGRVIRQSTRTGGTQIGSLGTLLESIGLDTVSERTRELGVIGRPQWHLNVLYAVEGEGPVHGTALLHGSISIVP